MFKDRLGTVRQYSDEARQIWGMAKGGAYDGFIHTIIEQQATLPETHEKQKTAEILLDRLVKTDPEGTRRYCELYLSNPGDLPYARQFCKAWLAVGVKNLGWPSQISEETEVKNRTSEDCILHHLATFSIERHLQCKALLESGAVRMMMDGEWNIPIINPIHQLERYQWLMPEPDIESFNHGL